MCKVVVATLCQHAQVYHSKDYLLKIKNGIYIKVKCLTRVIMMDRNT